MSSKAPVTKVGDRVVFVRLPERLDHRLREVAERDAQTLSSTIRRLVAVGLRLEAKRV